VRLAVLVRLGEHVGPDALQGLRADEVEAPVAREWRLSWRRQGLSRRYLLRQSEEACQRYLLRLQGRMEELHPEVDPEHYVCCEDERCTCGARATYAAEWARRGATVPPLVYWRIDSREVGEWEPEAITAIHLPEPEPGLEAPTHDWGPLREPVTVGSLEEFQRAYGPREEESDDIPF
jgi:hypothetical protein